MKDMRYIHPSLLCVLMLHFSSILASAFHQTCPVNCRPVKRYLRDHIKVCPHSNKTVFAGDGGCKTECKWSYLEGFSFCDTFNIFYRDFRWVDWDLCGLCNEKEEKMTPRGNYCDQNDPNGCTNKWNNYEDKGPRCRTTAGTLDWCTTCEEEKRRGAERSCPDFKEDSRPGKVLGLDWNHGLWKKE